MAYSQSPLKAIYSLIRVAVSLYTPFFPSLILLVAQVYRAQIFLTKPPRLNNSQGLQV